MGCTDGGKESGLQMAEWWGEHDPCWEKSPIVSNQAAHLALCQVLWLQWYSFRPSPFTCNISTSSRIVIGPWKACNLIFHPEQVLLAMEGRRFRGLSLNPSTPTPWRLLWMKKKRVNSQHFVRHLQIALIGSRIENWASKLVAATYFMWTH